MDINLIGNQTRFAMWWPSPEWCVIARECSGVVVSVNFNPPSPRSRATRKWPPVMPKLRELEDD